MIGLTELEYYTRSIPRENYRITVDKILDVGLFDACKGQFTQLPFNAGDNIDFLIKTSTPLRGKAHGEGLSEATRPDVPEAGSPGFIRMQIPLMELIDNCGITRQALKLAAGTPASWGSAVDMAISDMLKVSFRETLRYCMIGTGTGLLGRVSAASANGGVATITQDNNYTEMGWDNTQMMQPGMKIEIYASDKTTARSAAAGVEVTSVTFGNRKNAAIGGTVGTFTYTGAVTNIVDGDLVYRYGAISDGLGSGKPFPRGLFYMLQDGVHLTESAFIETSYFGLTRSTYSSLQGHIYQGDDYSDTGSAGTPGDWDLSTLVDIMLDIKRGTGKGEVDCVMTNSKLAACIGRLNKSENQVQVVVNTTSASVDQSVALPRIPKTVSGPNGEPVRLIVDEAVPNNSAILFDSRNLFMYQKDEFDFLRLDGGIWQHEMSTRHTDFEAPYGGFLTLVAERCDNMALAQDLADNIG